MKMSRLLLLVFVFLAPSLHAADGSLSFDGSGDYVEVPAFDTLGVTNEVTVEFWAKTNATAQQSAFMLNPDNGNNRFQAHISYFNGNTYWDFGDTATTGRLFTANPSGSTGNWTHYAFVASQSAATGNMRIYVNGVQIASKNTMDPFETAVAAALRIGGSTSYFLNGSLDDFRVWNVARSETDIRQTMGAPLSGSETGLRLYFKFDEGSGTTAVNSATATATTHPTGTVNGNPTWAAPARTTYTVTTNADSGTGSLRQALADAAAASGPALVAFDPALSEPIALSSEIVVSDTGGVTVDASSLAAGITVTGGNAKRLFFLDSGTIATFRAVTLTGGNGVGASDSGRGGAIYGNNATLFLDRCTLHGNSAPGGAGDGGAIFANFGIVSLTNCTLAANTAGSRGGRALQQRHAHPHPLHRGGEFRHRPGHPGGRRHL